jgi:cytoskeletal protein RodZ
MARSRSTATSVPIPEHQAASARWEAGRFSDGATFAAFLRNQRESRNIGVEQIAERTKISVRLLRGLEAGDVRHWPGGIYGRAIVRGYAEAIGLDSEEIVHEFVRLFAETDAPIVATASAPKPRDPRHITVSMRQTQLAAGVIAAAAVVFVATWYVKSQNATQAAPTEVRAAEPLSSRDSSPLTEIRAAAASTEQRELPQVQEVRNTEAAPAASRDVEGELRISSVPAGARVTVNGVGWGETPLTVRYLPMGDKRVRLTKDGYVTVERRIELTDERSVRTINVRLAEPPEPTPTGR